MKFLRNLVIFFFIILIGGLSILFYSYKIEPTSLVVNHIHLDIPTLNEKLVIVQLSDIEISKNYLPVNLRKVVEKINSINPDIIVFTGDLFSNYAQYKPTTEVINYLSQLHASIGKYAIFGNNDHGGGAIRAYENIMNESGFNVLMNESQRIEFNSNEIMYITGLDDDLLGNPSIEDAFDKHINQSNFNLLLIHEPYLIDNLLEYPYDLALSGHTHGGQIDFPFIDTSLLLSPSENKYLMGTYNFDNLRQTTLYVNSGLGTSRLPLRFLVPPEITVFTLD
ncbi:MAG: metallophosphoesterase [Anaerorhabdus sp.]|uniref:metallophosphoesterase n=1 Tax=Anaerorhabdus sp. TaxID=1872524 RepID=UPI002FC5A5EA